MRVAVLFGGRSHERAVSLRTGARVEQALRATGHEPVMIDADAKVGERLSASGADVAFIALHGRGGEDDEVQSLCESLGLPYTGTRSGPCGAAFHKARAKRLLRAARVDTPAFITFSQDAIEQFGAGDVRDEAGELGYPLVVKPARAGSSLGTRFVDEGDQLARALIGAMSYDTEVLLERHVRGRELAVAVLGSAAAGTARVLPAVEIVPRHADWFDYESRYTHGETEFTCPPSGLADDVLERVCAVSHAACAALDISGYGRVDIILDEEDRPWVLEVAPVPGLTETSLMTIACSAAGVTLESLVQSLLDDAIEQHELQGEHD